MKKYFKPLLNLDLQYFSTDNIDFSKLTLIRDRLGTPIPQYFDTIANMFVPLTEVNFSSGGGVTEPVTVPKLLKSFKLGDIDISLEKSYINLEDYTGEEQGLILQVANLNELTGAFIETNPDFTIVSAIGAYIRGGQFQRIPLHLAGYSFFEKLTFPEAWEQNNDGQNKLPYFEIIISDEVDLFQYSSSEYPGLKGQVFKVTFVQA